MFNYRDRDTILQAARKSGPMAFQNSTVTFFPDFTLKVPKQRQSFLEVKRALQDKELKYSMLFPASLRVESGGKAWFFATPEEAWEWLDGWRLKERGGSRSKKNSERLSIQ